MQLVLSAKLVRKLPLLLRKSRRKSLKLLGSANTQASSYNQPTFNRRIWSEAHGISPKFFKQGSVAAGDLKLGYVLPMAKSSECTFPAEYCHLRQRGKCGAECGHERSCSHIANS